MEHTLTMTIRLPAATKEKLERLAEATERSKAYLAAKAIEEFLAAQEWQVQAIREAAREADSIQARFVGHESVVKRMRFENAPLRGKERLKILWLEKAVVDLEEAYEFILLDNPPAAAGEVAKVLKAVELLSDNPAMGRPGRVPKTRELVVPGTPYLIIYRVKNDRLEVLRVFHGARQWPKKRRN